MYDNLISKMTEYFSEIGLILNSKAINYFEKSSVLMEEGNQQQPKQDDQEKYRNLQCRMYENEYPKPNELVLVSKSNI